MNLYLTGRNAAVWGTACLLLHRGMHHPRNIRFPVCLLSRLRLGVLCGQMFGLNSDALKVRGAAALV